MAAKRTMIAAVVSGVLTTGGAALGQSFNVDLAQNAQTRGAGVPSASFGGAPEQPGFWNEFDTSVDGPVAVSGLDGEPIEVSLMLQGPDYVVHLDDPKTEGDVAALLDDSICGFGDVVGGVMVRGLIPGSYRVVVYGFAGGQPEQLTYFMVGNQAGVTGGAWSGRFEEGVTHKTFGVNVLEGELFIAAAGGIWGQSGYMNGFQLTALDECFADLNHDGFLDAGDIHEFIRLFLGGDPEVDLNHDGVLDSGDIVEFVRSFLEGC